MVPRFPNFKAIEITDRNVVQEKLWDYKPDTSELNFTNLFMWRHYYGFQWSIYKDWLFILATSKKEGYSFFQPIGPKGRQEIALTMMEWLRDEKKEKKPRIVRADQRMDSELKEDARFMVQPVPNHFDYVYQSQDLTLLAGRKYHAKRNHINKFRRLHTFEYMQITPDLVQNCLRFYERWCNWHRCKEDNSLMWECEAIHDTFWNLEALHLKGGAILINGEVRAFALGELLNETTAVVHIEKADPEIPQLYTMMNQQFCEHAWQDVELVNREQDLGKPGLKKAKESLYPQHLVKKYLVTLK